MKKNYWHLLILAVSFFALQANAQNAAINEDGSLPNPNAILDVKSFNKGILIPRVSTTGRLTIPNTKGLLVYDTTAGSFWYNTGSGWKNMASDVSTTTGWSLTGNSGTTDSNFLGTINDRPLIFKVKNQPAGRIDADLHNNTFLGFNTGAVNVGDENTANGSQALTSNTTGHNNTAIGCFSSSSNITGINNTALGAFSLYLNTTGIQNTAIGNFSLRSNNGNDNTAIGVSSLKANTLGRSNTATGAHSLISNTIGNGNTGSGYQSLFFNESGADNTAVGRSSLFSNTIGSLNVAVGGEALFSNISGFNNSVVGWRALGQNTFGTDNTALGRQAMNSNLTGSYNVAVGNYALFSTTGSQFNTAVGFNSCSGFNLGFNNTLIGANTSVSQNGLFNCVALGESSICTASSQVRLGNFATTSIGGIVGYSNLSDARYKKNVQEAVNGIDFIMKLRPVTYQLDITGISSKLNESRDKEMNAILKAAMAAQEKTVFTGFVAQEVEEAAKTVGYNFSGVDKPKNENDMYGLRYAEFVVPLVKAVQQQQKIIADMQKQIDELKKTHGSK
jgi:trimeric autotransporter adhesin